MNEPSDYSEQKWRRIEQFDRCLEQMVQRRRQERRCDCAITFSEDPLDEDNSKVLETAIRRPRVREGARELGPAADGLSGRIWVPEDDGGRSESAGSGRRDDGRFIQFAFMRRTFFVDLPDNVLCRPEAQVLIRRRSGFFHLRDRRWPFMSFQSWQRTVREWGPVQKEYLNGDTRSASEDMAFVLYSLWHWPIDAPVYYRALVFNGRKRRPWEGTGVV